MCPLIKSNTKHLFQDAAQYLQFLFSFFFLFLFKSSYMKWLSICSAIVLWPSVVNDFLAPSILAVYVTDPKCHNVSLTEVKSEVGFLSKATQVKWDDRFHHFIHKKCNFVQKLPVEPIYMVFHMPGYTFCCKYLI